MRNGVDLEFEVLSPIEISVFYEDAETGAEWEKNLDYNLTPLTEVVTLLAKRHGGIRGHSATCRTRIIAMTKQYLTTRNYYAEFHPYPI